MASELDKLAQQFMDAGWQPEGRYLVDLAYVWRVNKRIGEHLPTDTPVQTIGQIIEGTFAEKLRGYRESLGMPQKTLGSLLNLDPTHINKIEKGRRKPPRAQTVALMTRHLRLSDEVAEDFVQSAGYSPIILRSHSQTRR